MNRQLDPHEQAMADSDFDKSPQEQVQVSGVLIICILAAVLLSMLLAGYSIRFWIALVTNGGMP